MADLPTSNSKNIAKRYINRTHIAVLATTRRMARLKLRTNFLITAARTLSLRGMRLWPEMTLHFLAICDKSSYRDAQQTSFAGHRRMYTAGFQLKIFQYSHTILYSVRYLYWIIERKQLVVLHRKGERDRCKL